MLVQLIAKVDWFNLSGCLLNEASVWTNLLHSIGRPVFASHLAALLSQLSAQTDVGHRTPSDVAQRFERLRGFRLMPTGPDRNVSHLSDREVAAGVLSLASATPGFAAVTSNGLLRLLPVGGVKASFRGHASFGDAVEELLSDQSVAATILEIRVSPSEIYTNSYFRASIEYQAEGSTRVSYYVGSTAISLHSAGAEKTFNPRNLISLMIVETVFYRYFFERLADHLEQDRIWRKRMPKPAAAPPIEDEDEDAQQEARARYLGLTSSSSFLNLGIEGQIDWPRRETVVEFEGRKIILLPATADNSASVHVDLHGSKLGIENARTLLDRFLSLLTWCDDRAAILKDGWAGNPIPVAVSRDGPRIPSTEWWIFNRKLPQDPRALKALALYRQGRTAEYGFLVSYAVLSYYKVFELNEPTGRAGAKRWLLENYPAIRSDKYHEREVTEFEARSCPLAWCS